MSIAVIFSNILDNVQTPALFSKIIMRSCIIINISCIVVVNGNTPRAKKYILLFVLIPLIIHELTTVRSNITNNKR